MEAGYKSRIVKISEKIFQLEKEKEELSFYATALQNPQKESSSILEKIFYDQSPIFNAFYKLYLCCSKEMTESFKKRLIEALEENSPKNLVSWKAISQEIKKSFSHKIMIQKLNFVIKGKDISTHATESSAYFILYFTIKKIMKNLPKKGRIEILLRLSESDPKIIIKDTGFSFSEERLKNFPALSFQKTLDFPEDPPFEDIKNVSQMCGWKIHHREKEGLFNITEISLLQKEERIVDKETNIIYLKNLRRSLMPI